MNDSKTTLAEIQQAVHDFRIRRGWTETDPKDVALSLVLEAGEVLEHFQWVQTVDVIETLAWRQAVGEELADVLFLISELASQLDLDLAAEFEKKLKKQAKKYPVSDFNPTMTREEQLKSYYAVKAKTWGSHPLADEPDRK